MKDLSDVQFTNELTEVLDGLLEQKKGELRFGNYMMEHSKKKDGGTIYAIRHPGATRGNVITDSAGVIVQIILDETFYGKGAYAAVAKYIGAKMVVFEEV